MYAVDFFPTILSSFTQNTTINWLIGKNDAFYDACLALKMNLLQCCCCSLFATSSSCFFSYFFVVFHNFVVIFLYFLWFFLFFAFFAFFASFWLTFVRSFFLHIRSFNKHTVLVHNAKQQIDDSVFSCSCCVLNRTYQNVNITTRPHHQKKHINLLQSCNMLCKSDREWMSCMLCRMHFIIEPILFSHRKVLIDIRTNHFSNVVIQCVFCLSKPNKTHKLCVRMEGKQAAVARWWQQQHRKKNMKSLQHDFWSMLSFEDRVCFPNKHCLWLCTKYGSSEWMGIIIKKKSALQ